MSQLVSSGESNVTELMLEIKVSREWRKVCDKHESFGRQGSLRIRRWELEPLLSALLLGASAGAEAVQEGAAARRWDDRHDRARPVRLRGKARAHHWHALLISLARVSDSSARTSCHVSWSRPALQVHGKVTKALAGSGDCRNNVPLPDTARSG